jgi:hypothetical protein
MKKLLTTAAVLVALVAPAMALDATKAAYLDAGKTIRFNTPWPLTVGCTQTDDAVRVVKLVRQKNWNALEEFVEWIDHGEKQDRMCVVLNASSDNSWTIAKSTPLDRNRGRWACLQAQYDFRPVAEQNVPSSCFWIYVW